MRAKVVPDAVSRFKQSLKLPAHAGFSRQDWQWIAVLSVLQGREWRVVGPVEGGVQGCVYLLLDDEEGNPVQSFQGHGSGTYRISSHVAAVSSDLILSMTEGEPVRPPAEDASPSAWWEEKGLKTVRLVTPWVDGFQAFTPKTI